MVKFEATDGDGNNMGLSEMEVYPSPEGYADYVSKVDPYYRVDLRTLFFCDRQPAFRHDIGSSDDRNKTSMEGGSYNSL